MKSEFYTQVDELLVWGLGQFPFLLPKLMFSRYLATQLERSCSGELSRNVGRLQADLGNCLEQSTSDYLRALDRHVEEAGQSVLAALHPALALRKSSEQKSLEAQAALTASKERLWRIDEELAQLQAAWSKLQRR